MKKFVLCLLSLIFISCGGGGSSGGVGGSRSIELSGNLYNPSEGAAFSIMRYETQAAAIGDRIAAVTQSQMIMVDTDVINDGTEALTDLSYEVWIEANSHYTAEYWSCLKRFYLLNDPDSVYGFGVWQVNGGTLLAPQPPPVLPACEGEVRDAGFVCEGHIPALDCDSPFYEVEYNEPGDGFWKVVGGIGSLNPGGIINLSSGYSNSNMGVRTDHIAKWFVKDSKGDVIKTKEYLFDVVP